MPQEQRQGFWRVDAGSVLVLFGMLASAIYQYGALGQRLDAVERTQQQQGAQLARNNSELHEEIRGVALTIGADVKDQGAAIRRIEDKINRARL